jgi:poly(A) polymerase Pap1
MNSTVQVISTAQPTKEDHEQAIKIEEVLRAEKRYPPQEESAQREEVLAQLDQVVKQWVINVSMKLVKLKTQIKLILLGLF